MRRWLAVVGLLILVALGVVNVPTTIADAATFNYDAPSIARVVTHRIVTVPNGSPQLMGSPEGAAWSPATDPGPSTTSSRCVVATNTARPGTALQPYYPANNGFHGTPKPTSLQPGATLDRYGSDFGRFTSPTGTPMHQRALPPGAEDGAYSAFRVVEPLTVQAGQVAPAFGSFGGGTQYLLPKSVKELLESGVIERVTP